MSGGVNEGFIITSINNQPVNAPSDVRKILENHRVEYILKEFTLMEQ
jgi:S1-C subfamily serine protease